MDILALTALGDSVAASVKDGEIVVVPIREIGLNIIGQKYLNYAYFINVFRDNY